MRTWVVLLMVPVLASPCLAAKRVAVDQLEQIVSAGHGKSDGKMADELHDLELTQRLSAKRLALELAALPGAGSRQALKSIADIAEFLDLPAADLPPTPPPDRAAQIALWKSTLDQAGKTIHSLPNFFATRETELFEDTPPEPPRNTVDSIRYAPLHQVGDDSVTVLYRDGHEFLDTKGSHHVNYDPANFELSTAGEFGPILATVLADSEHGQVFWSHWEQRDNGTIAVFRYSVAKPDSHYTVNLPGPDHNTQFNPPYHGEIGIDPADGSILRLTMIAELKSTDPVTRTDLLVNYGPVEIGGSTYNCPIRSVAVTLVHEVQVSSDGFGDPQSRLGPLQTRVNDVVFKNYHLFRAEIRILTDAPPAPEISTPPAAPTPTPQTSPHP